MWTFLHPTFLYAAAAAVVPLILHLIQRRRVVRIRFSTLRFLRWAQQRSTRRVRLENFLLWLLRTALVLLLTASFAGPVLRTRRLTGLGAGAPRDVAVVWDVSFSMGYASGLASVWDESRRAVEGIVGSLRQGDRVCVFLADDQTTALIEEPTADTALALRLIRAQQPQPVPSTLRPAVEAALGALRRSGRRERELFIVTDGQARPWAEWKAATAVERAPREEAAHRETRLAVFVLLAGPREPENVAPCDLRVEPLLLLPDRSATLTARLGFSGRSRTTSLTLFLDGAEVARRNVDLGQTTEVLFSLPPLEAGIHIGVLETPVDALAADDTLHFLLRVEDRLPVLCVGTEEDTFFLMRALDPGGGRSPLASRRLDPSALSHEDPARYSGIFLCNALPLPGPTVLRLEQYVRAGGMLAVFPGDRAAPADCEVWTCWPAVPTAVRDLGPSAALRAIRVVRPQDPLLFTLRMPPGVVPSVAIRRSLVVGPLAPDAVALLTLGEEEPFLLARSYGAGRVLLFTTTANRTWSNFPLSPFFLPLVHQIALFGRGRINERPFTSVGRTLVLTGPASLLPENAVLVAPSGRLLPVQTSRPGAEEPPFVEGALEPGIYRLAALDPTAARPVVAVNLDRTESDLTPIDETGVVSLLEKAFGWRHVVTVRSPADLLQRVEEERYGRPLVEPLLWLALVLSVAEFFLACRAAGALVPDRKGLRVTSSGRVTGEPSWRAEVGMASR